MHKTKYKAPFHVSIKNKKDWHDNTKLVDEIFRIGRGYLENQGFTEVVTPHIVRASGACENIDTLFEVSVEKNHDWFDGKKGYLAQTGQLYLESLVPELGKVYCSGPSFRAEPESDHRHLAEFYMVEIEFAGTFDKLLNYIEGFLSNIAHSVADYPEPEFLGLSEDDVERLKSYPRKFDRITYDEAIKELAELEEDIKWGDDISSKREQMLVVEHGNNPILITRYPDPMHNHGKEIEVEKFFNMLPDKQNKGRVLSSDCILPFAGEAVGSAARVHKADELERRLLNSRMYKRLQNKGGDIDDFNWYLSRIKNDGSVPHAGCGFGMARIIQWIKGSPSVLHGVTFPLNRANLI
ncbi:MAG: hypothetical protein HY226_06790 [Candidatus Vogelbacteria bacterium]|nr:hypothetical protein [Candidatus Vogelbacteria bacterium]